MPPDEDFVRILRHTYFTTPPVIKEQMISRLRSSGRGGVR
jgi:hypothetical protein